MKGQMLKLFVVVAVCLVDCRRLYGASAVTRADARATHRHTHANAP